MIFRIGGARGGRARPRPGDPRVNAIAVFLDDPTVEEIRVNEPRERI
jgi:hypothetical protein